MWRDFFRGLLIGFVQRGFDNETMIVTFVSQNELISSNYFIAIPRKWCGYHNITRIRTEMEGRCGDTLTSSLATDTAYPIGPQSLGNENDQNQQIDHAVIASCSGRSHPGIICSLETKPRQALLQV
jgi:hypothetical protein